MIGFRTVSGVYMTLFVSEGFVIWFDIGNVAGQTENVEPLINLEIGELNHESDRQGVVQGFTESQKYV